VICLAPRARENIVRPRRLAEVVARPLSFTVRTRVDALLKPLLALFGFIAGTQFTLQMFRWGTLLWVTTTTHGGDFLGAPRRRLLWFFPFVLLLHPAPYIAALVVLVTVWALQGKLGSIWLWPLAGFYTYCVFASLKLSHLYQLQRRRRAAAGPNNRWRGP
jgi:hypothetical protein